MPPDHGQHRKRASVEDRLAPFLRYFPHSVHATHGSDPFNTPTSKECFATLGPQAPPTLTPDSALIGSRHGAVDLVFAGGSAQLVPTTPPNRTGATPGHSHEGHGSNHEHADLDEMEDRRRDRKERDRSDTNHRNAKQLGPKRERTHYRNLRYERRNRKTPAAPRSKKNGNGVKSPT